MSSGGARSGCSNIVGRIVLEAAASLASVGFELDTLLGEGMVAVRGVRLG